MRSNWSARCMACLALLSVITMKRGLLTWTQAGAESRAKAILVEESRI
jgi:hypothetical protein